MARRSSIDRPDKLNAMNHAWFREMVALLAEDADPDVKAVVLTGGGDRAFSAGWDIEDFNRIHDSPYRAGQARTGVLQRDRARRPS